MARYVALLGSINVGGNRLKMAELKEALEKVGLEQIVTIGASGNVLFEHPRVPDKDLERIFEKVLADDFGILSFAAVRSRAELAAAIDENPFAKDGAENLVHTMFLDATLDKPAFEAFAKDYSGPERLAPGRREFFVDFEEGVARSKLDSAMRRANFSKARATARNIRSLKRILAKMDD